MFLNRIFFPALLICTLLLLPFLASAQSFDRKLRYAERELGLEFKMPAGFVAVDSGKVFLCGDNKRATLKVFTIMSADSSVKIAFGFTYPIATKNLVSLKRFNPGYDDNRNYLMVAKSLADTVSGKLVLYDKEYSAKKFNAQNAGEYTRACNIPYEALYSHHRVVFFQRDNQGHVEITYFYKNDTQLTIDSVISSTAGMIKYKQPVPATKQ